MSSFDFSDRALDRLRETVRAGLSEYRFRHIAEVERMIVRLGELYLPDELPMLRAAALLHDLTKELPTPEQEYLLASHGILLSESDRLSPKLYHAWTAALRIPEDYPHFAREDLVTAVRYHTTGRKGMTLPEMLLYLADFIDESRLFGDCVRLRAEFWDADPRAMSAAERITHLYRVLVHTVDATVAHLLADGRIVSVDSIEMRNDLLARLEAALPR